ncbi:MAG: winged helix-turn-helix transcriptional regulator [Anaerolineaceae bacterium]|nr:winged helix-turn-helix transcriptional regulator [Anaerolineaceae bacterium]
MKLEWLGEYRKFVEKTIKFANAYASTYQKEQSFGTKVMFSSSQIQTIEYILENEDKNQTMAEIAERLGISRSAFSKNVKKMIEKGLLEKYRTSDNHKNIIVRVSPLGREAYNDYCKYVKNGIMDKMFAELDGIPKEYLEKVCKALDMWSEDINRQPTAPKQTTLIRIK